MAESKANSIIGAVDLVLNSAAGAPAEGWYQIDLAGQWNGHPSGAYKLTPSDIRGIVDQFNLTCLANSVELPVDYEHNGIIAKLLGKSAESGGWINALEARENGTQLWAHITWVNDALDLIRAKKFRYLSSHLVRDYKDPISGRVIPWALDSVALTNRPFKKELPAVANSDAAASGLEEALARAPNSAVAEQEGTAMDPLLDLLATAMSLDAKAVANSLGVAEGAKADVVVPALVKLLSAGDQASKRLKVFANSLGVAETADEAAIKAALDAKVKPAAGDADVKVLAICNALGTTPDKPLAELLTLLSSTRANPKAVEAASMIENAISIEHKITPANRGAFLALALKDLESTRAILNSMPAILNIASSPAASSAAAGSAILTDADKWACQQHGIKEADFLAMKRKLAV